MDNDKSDQNLSFSRVENLLHVALKNLEYERDKLKKITDDSVSVFENIRNTLFSFLGLGFSIIFGLPFILGEDLPIEPIWLLGTLILIIGLGSIIFVITNIYTNKLTKSLGIIDRVYLDGLSTLTLIEFFLTRKTVKFQNFLSKSEVESLYSYMELLIGGIYSSLDDKYKESINQIPIDSLKKIFQSQSPIDTIFIDEICIEQQKNLELENILSLKNILQIHSNFPDIVEKMFISSLRKRCTCK